MQLRSNANTPQWIFLWKVFLTNRQRISLESRIEEIDKIIRCLYEDRVVGRITSKRYDELECGYELKQSESKQELESITERIAEMDM